MHDFAKKAKFQSFVRGVVFGLSGSNSSTFGKRADLLPEVTLLPHQKRVIEKIKKEPAMLVWHGLGSGKTLASIAAAEGLGGQTQVVVPASLRENFRKELSKFVTNSDNYHIQSYDQATTYGIPKSKTVIFDEAHRLGREGTQVSRLTDDLSSDKTIFLSGTPIRNSPSELVPILRELAKDRNPPQTAKEFDERFITQEKIYPSLLRQLMGVKPGAKSSLKNVRELQNLVAGRVDYHASVGEFPSTEDEDIEVEMLPFQQHLYRELMRSSPALSYKIRHNLPPSKSESPQLNAFLSATRQISNNPASYDLSMAGKEIENSPKLQRMLVDLHAGRLADKNFKAYIYSNYLDSGLIPLAAALKSQNVPHVMFTGKMNDADRKAAVDAYNSGKVKIILASPAGTEGLDLKGTKLVQIMEPHWNFARIDQAIGRAVRHQSHSHLPENERKVTIRRYYTTPTQGFMARSGMIPPEIGSDRYLHGLSNQKKMLIDQALNAIRAQNSQ